MEQKLVEFMEEVRPNLMQGWLFGKQVVVYQPLDSTRETVDSWCEVMEKTFLAWEPGHPYLEIQDFRRIGLTPYNRQKAIELAKKHSTVRGYSALVIENSLLGNVIRIFTNTAVASLKTNMVRRAFVSWDDALLWIENTLKER